MHRINAPRVPEPGRQSPLSRVMRIINRRRVYRLWHWGLTLLNKPFLPRPAERDLPLINKLREERVLVTSLEELGLPTSPDFLKASERIYDHLPAEAAGEKAFETGTDRWCRHLPHDVLCEKTPELLLWGLQDRILDIAEHVIGMPPALIGLEIRHDDWGGKDTASRLWHRDGEDIVEFKVIVYLSEVDERTPVFQLIPARDTKAIDKKILTNIPHDAMVEHIPESKHLSVHGGRGTVLMCVTSAVWHRGRPPIAEPIQGRLTANFAYTSRHPMSRAGCLRHFSKEAAMTLKPRLTKRQREALFWYEP